MPSEEKLICIGKILGPHGIKGEVKIKSFTEIPKALFSLPVLYTSKENEVFIQSFRISKKQQEFIVRLASVFSRSEAELFKGMFLYTRRSLFQTLKDEDAFYHIDLIGLIVKDVQGNSLGKITAIYNFGAGDIIEIQFSDPFSSQMIPFSSEFFEDIYPEKGAITLKKSFLS